MKKHVNLLPISYRRRQLFRRRLRQWFVVWTIATAAISTLAWDQSERFRRSDSRLEALRGEYEPLQNLKEQTVELADHIRQLRQRETLALTLSGEKPMLTVLGWLSRAARDTGGRVTIRTFDIEPNNASAGIHTQHVLMLEGVAMDNEDIARFAQALRDSQAFDRVDLKFTLNAQVHNRKVQSYRMECLF